MKTIITAAVLSFSAAFGATLTTAHADTLSSLESACRTGVYSACSQYNAAVFKSSGTQSSTMIYGFDPFAIVPATHSERTPSTPADQGANAGNGDLTAAITVVSQ